MVVKDRTAVLRNYSLNQDLLSASSTRRMGPGFRSARKWYFETLLVQVPSHRSAHKDKTAPANEKAKLHGDSDARNSHPL